MNQRVFFVNYRFLTCGDVFTEGLRNAARELGITARDAYWDDPHLPAKVSDFNPSLLFVVHGRRFAQRFGGAFHPCTSAAWLLDEPYEVDDTATWSRRFDTVYSNDPNTLRRHHNAHYLPVAYDPWVHREVPGDKQYAVGFIGGYNPTRETLLLKLLDAGLLSYVVGGPWKDHRLKKLCLAENIQAAQVASLYQKTRLVVNIFRDLHHFNRSGIRPWSLNPRIYEALGCGALVISERRAEIENVFPELPLFRDAAQLVSETKRLLDDVNTYERLVTLCRGKLTNHTYAKRLAVVLSNLKSQTVLG